MCVYVTGVKKCRFFGEFYVRTKLMVPLASLFRGVIQSKKDQNLNNSPQRMKGCKINIVRKKYSLRELCDKLNYH